MNIEITLTERDTRRRCGDCQLCCRLLPVRSVDKGANERCRHQKFGKGCQVYYRLESVAPECRLWSCAWLTEQAGAGIGRPDRVHYVVDPMPDYVETIDNETGEHVTLAVTQIWVDPAYPDAHRDPALRRWLDEEKRVAIVRYNGTDGFTLFPPSRSGDRRWHEAESESSGESHTPTQLFEALARAV